MERIAARRAVWALVALAVAVGAALPALGRAAGEGARALIGTAQLRDGAVTDQKVRRGSLRYGAFKARQVAPWSLQGIPARGALTGRFPAPGIATGAVGAAQIARGAVGRSELAAGAVGSEELAAGAVRAIDIANGSIGAAKISPNSIGRGQIAPGGVGASELAPGAVGPSELQRLPGARAALAAALELAPGAVAIVPLGAVDYAQGGVWSGERPDRLTAPVDGVYQLTGSARFEDNGTGARGVWLTAGGDAGAIIAGEQQTPAMAISTPTELAVAAVVRLAAGESVSLAVQQTSGRPLALLAEGGRTALGLQFLSP